MLTFVLVSLTQPYFSPEEGDSVFFLFFSFCGGLSLGKWLCLRFVFIGVFFRHDVPASAAECFRLAKQPSP